MEKLRGQKWYKFVSVIYVLALPKRAYQQVGVRRNVSSIPIRETSAKTSAVKPIFKDRLSIHVPPKRNTFAS